MKKFLFLLILFICSFMITNKQVYASGHVINNMISEPMYSDTSGYVSVLMRNKANGKFYTRLYAWYGSQLQGGGSSFVYPFDVQVKLTDTTVTLDFYGDVNKPVTMNLYVTWGIEAPSYYDQGLSYGNYTVGEDGHRVTYSNANYDIVGFVYKGNVITCTYSLTENYTFINNWGSESNQYNQMLTIIDVLTNILNQGSDNYSDILDKLDELINVQYSIEDYLSKLYDLVEEYYPKLYDLLDVYIKSIDSELNEIDEDLEKIIEILEAWNNAQLGESTEPLPNDGISSNNDKENALINKGSVGSITSNVGIELDTTANNSIWSIANSFITCNSLVFGLFISLLSLGVVKLILNR